MNEREKAAIRLAFVGDVLVGDSHDRIGWGIGSLLEKSGVRVFNSAVLSKYGGDLLIGNLECPVDSGRGRDKKGYLGRSSSLGILREAGFDVVTLANNHIWDHGAMIARDTARRCDERGLFAVGPSPQEMKVVAVNGLRVGFIAFSVVDVVAKEGHWNWAAVKVAVNSCVASADVCIALVHWGAEYMEWPSAWQVRLTERLWDLGVPLVVGTHPHVPQPAVRVGRKGVLFSLGNFCSDMDWWPAARSGLVVVVEVDRETGTLRGGECQLVRSIPTVGGVGTPLSGIWEIPEVRDIRKWHSGEVGQGEKKKYHERASSVRRKASIAMRRALIWRICRRPSAGMYFIKYKLLQRAKRGAYRLDGTMAWALGGWFEFGKDIWP